MSRVVSLPISVASRSHIRRPPHLEVLLDSLAEAVEGRHLGVFFGLYRRPRWYRTSASLNRTASGSDVDWLSPIQARRRSRMVEGEIVLPPSSCFRIYRICGSREQEASMTQVAVDIVSQVSSARGTSVRH